MREVTLIRTAAMPRETGQITDIRQSPGFAKFMVTIGWEETKIGSLNVFSKKIPLFGYVIRIVRPNLPLPLEEIDRLAQQKKALLVKIEPNLLETNSSAPILGSFVKDHQPILPTKTIWIDLSQSETKLWENLDKDTRNLVRKSEKEGVQISASTNLANFYDIWKNNAKKKGFFTPFDKEMTSLWNSFSEKHLLLATYNKQTVAAVLLFGYKEALYYYFAASNEAGRKVHAPTNLLWHSIKIGHSAGYLRLDLEGIRDTRVSRTKKWEGFSNFKRNFGGSEISYTGSFSKYYSFLGLLIGRFL